MGVKDFTKLVKKYAPEVIETKEYSDFAGETWGLDGSIFFYRFAHDAESKKSNPHIDGFYQLFHRLYKNGIRPVVILDGKKPKEKLNTLKKRAKQKQNNINKVNNLQEELVSMLGGVLIDIESEIDMDFDDESDPQVINTTSASTLNLEQLVEMYKGHPCETQLKNKLEEINKAKKNIIHFQPGVYQDIYALCSLFSVPILRANYEADALCAKLYTDGKINAIMSEDSDILLYNGGRLIRKFNWSNKVELIDLNKLLQKLQITYDQFIDLCILCGTDYTVTTIDGMGCVRAYELISQGYTIEQIIDKIQKSKTSTDKSLKTFRKYTLPEDLSDFDYQGARSLVKQAYGLENNIDSIQPFDLNNINFDQLKTMMVEKCSYQTQTIDKHKPQIFNGKILYDQPKKEKIKLSLKTNPNKILLKEKTCQVSDSISQQKIKLALKVNQ